MQWEGSGVLNRGVAWSNYCSNRIIRCSAAGLQKIGTFHQHLPSIDKCDTLPIKRWGQCPPLWNLGRSSDLLFPVEWDKWDSLGIPYPGLRSIRSFHFLFYRSCIPSKESDNSETITLRKPDLGFWRGRVEKKEGTEPTARTVAHILFYYPMPWVISVIELWSRISWDHRQWSGDKSWHCFLSEFLNSESWLNKMILILHR